ncbi:MAG: hypothetical protein ABIN39_04645 [candidate division WOR-3 bacterium]
MKKIFFVSFFFLTFHSYLLSLTIFLDCEDQNLKSFLMTKVKNFEFSNIKEESDVFFVLKRDVNETNISFTLFSYGQNKYKNLSDTIKLFFDKNISEYDIYQNLYKSFIVMLLGNFFEQDYLEKVSITETEKIVEEKKVYGWNFNLEGLTELYSENQYKNNLLKVKLGGNRFINDDQIKLDISFSVNKKYFYLDSNRILTSFNRNIFSEVEYIQAINDRISSRVKLDGYNSIFSNYKLKNDLSIGIEYSLFPYVEGNTRLLKISYEFKPSFIIYYDTTVYDRIREILHRNIIKLSYNVLFPKGNISLSLLGSNYIQYFDQYSLSLEGRMKLYFFKGFSVNLYGDFVVPRDKRNIQKAGYTDEDLLLLQKERATDYAFFLEVSLSYTWGSKYINIESFRF